jgi:hypothetical protein
MILRRFTYLEQTRLLSVCAVGITAGGNQEMNPQDPVTDQPEVDLTHEDQQHEFYVGGDEIWPPYADPSYSMPPEIEVQVELLSGVYSFPVTIIKNASKKPYFGGFRNTVNRKLYHHASTQTPTEKKTNQRELSHLRTRETQTFDQKSVSVQPIREHGTQMQRIDLYLDHSRDVYLTPQPYFTSEELMYLKREKCVEIQRVWRGYMARCRAIRLRHSIAEQEEKVLIARSPHPSLHSLLTYTPREHEDKGKQEERLVEMRKRTHPTTNADFSRLYNELDQWRRAEVVKIKARTKPGEERTKAMEELLQEETLALQNIQKLKTVAHRDTVTEKTQRMLELMAQPQKWQLSDGDTAVVSTPATVRAKELLDLYNALNSPLVNTNARLEILLNVKWTVKESISQASSSPSSGHVLSSSSFNIHKEIMDLVDREADLLNRGRYVQSLFPPRLASPHLTLTPLQTLPEHGLSAEKDQQPLSAVHRESTLQPPGCGVH